MADSASKTGRSWWQGARHALDAAASVAVVVGVVVLVFQLRSQKPAAGPAPRPTGVTVPKEPLSLDGASLIGNPGATVAILEFSDFECPYCGAFARDVFPTLRTQLIESGRVLFAFRNLPIKGHARAEPAALAATCAMEQGRFESLHETLFGHQKDLDERSLEKYTAFLKVDRPAFAACLKSTGPTKVAADKKEAEALGVTGTPTFFIGTIGPDRKLAVRTAFKGSRPVAEFLAAVDSALTGK
jgi:protein-disulfide isomerase